MGSGGLQGCEMLGISHSLDIRLIDGGEAVSLTRGPGSTPQKHLLVLISVTG
jgi:hypothetical protein